MDIAIRRIARERAREVGCDGYLAKPVESCEVMEEIRRRVGAERAFLPDR